MEESLAVYRMWKFALAMGGGEGGRGKHRAVHVIHLGERIKVGCTHSPGRAAALLSASSHLSAGVGEGTVPNERTRPIPNSMNAHETVIPKNQNLSLSSVHTSVATGVET